MLLRVEGPDPAGFSYYSDIVPRDESGAPAKWHISIIEYVVSV